MKLWKHAVWQSPLWQKILVFMCDLMLCQKEDLDEKPHCVVLLQSDGGSFSNVKLSDPSRGKTND